MNAYEWESKVTADHFADLAGLLPHPFWIVGLAVVNEETGEAALIPNPRTLPAKGSGDIFDADVWGDICGDAQRLYSGILGDAFGPK